MNNLDFDDEDLSPEYAKLANLKNPILAAMAGDHQKELEKMQNPDLGGTANSMPPSEPPELGDFDVRANMKIENPQDEMPTPETYGKLSQLPKQQEMLGMTQPEKISPVNPETFTKLKNISPNNEKSRPI